MKIYLAFLVIGWSVFAIWLGFCMSGELYFLNYLVDSLGVPYEIRDFVRSYISKQ